MTATSSKDGEFETSTTTWAPLSTSANPSPVSVLTPVLGAAATASCPPALSFVMSFDPIRPVPPITTIFILFAPSFFAVQAFATSELAQGLKRGAQIGHEEFRLLPGREVGSFVVLIVEDQFRIRL